MLVLTGCGGSSAVRTKASDYVEHSVRKLAIAPPDDLFASESSQLSDAVGLELAGHGYLVVSAPTAKALLAKYNLTPESVLTPQALADFDKEGVDAVLSVHSSAASIGGPGMRHVQAKVISTRTVKEIGGIDWTNSWGGMPGSIADHIARKSAADVAKAIADAVAKLLG